MKKPIVALSAMAKPCVVASAVLCAAAPLFAANAETGLGKVRTTEYRELQSRLCRGWNTWFNDSMTTQVKLPERIGFNFGLAFWSGVEYERHFLKYSEKWNRSDRIVPGLRADDGSYTSAKIGFRDFDVLLETATDGDDMLAVVTPLDNAEGRLVVVEPSLPYGGEGELGLVKGRLVCSRGGTSVSLGTTGKVDDMPYMSVTTPRLAVRIPKKDKIGFATGRERTIEEIDHIVSTRREAVERRVASYGEMGDDFRAMQTILAWNNIYDAPHDRAIAPVSRVWNKNWRGWVLFDWDTYFAAYMFSMFNKDLAYANAVEITKCVMREGFIPNYASGAGPSWDRSQPPVGSKIVWEIYRRHREEWLLRETYDELLAWNRWWPEARELDGYLCWGSHGWKDGKRVPGSAYNAKLESGLDNSPMFDDVPMHAEKPVMVQADVGLMSLYVMDCRALAEIADALGKAGDRAELLARAEKYGERLKTLWSDEKGIFMNKRLDTGEFNPVLSPCNFYPLLAGVATKVQAERMVKEHYFNPDEFHGAYVVPASARNARGFKDNTYWRGRIWAPLNLLVYLGMRDYRLDEARLDLVKRSRDLLMKSWKATGAIYENYNSTTGVGGDVGNSDGFYHWGALLTYIGFLEQEIKQGQQR